MKNAASASARPRFCGLQFSFSFSLSLFFFSFLDNQTPLPALPDAKRGPILFPSDFDPHFSNKAGAKVLLFFLYICPQELADFLCKARPSIKEVRPGRVEKSGISCHHTFSAFLTIQPKNQTHDLVSTLISPSDLSPTFAPAANKITTLAVRALVPHVRQSSFTCSCRRCIWSF